VLAAADPAAEAPVAMRQAGTHPWALRVPSLRDAGLGDAVRAEVTALSEGRLAVIVPVGLREEVVRVLRKAVPQGFDERGVLDSPVAVLTVREAKGLEFDVVVVVEPLAMVHESPRGLNDLYVALTRSTRRLGIVHTGDLPAMLSGLRPVVAAADVTADL
jgi:hypothetical protein